MVRRYLLPSLALFLLFAAGVRPAQAQSNFQILPAPIAYPYFEPDRTDIKIGAGYGSVTGHEVDIHGGGAFFIGRRAVSEYVALDGMFGLFGMNGEMPGLALPFIYLGNVFSPVIEGKGQLSGIGLPMGLNLEVQPIHTPRGSLILFGGPNLSIYSLNLDTPYHAVSGGSTAASTTFNTKSTVVMGGFQLGVQAGVNLGPITVAPFYMVITQSGSATFTFDNGYQNTVQFEGDAQDIEPFVVNSYGFDLLYRPWNLSIGTLIQNSQSTTNQEGYKTTTVQASWHFRSK